MAEKKKKVNKKITITQVKSQLKKCLDLEPLNEKIALDKLAKKSGLTLPTLRQQLKMYKEEASQLKQKEEEEAIAKKKQEENEEMEAEQEIKRQQEEKKITEERIKNKKKAFDVDATKYLKLLDPNRETNKVKVKFLKDYGEGKDAYKKDDELFISTKNFILFQERDICKSIQTHDPTQKAWDDFNAINSLKTINQKHREWLKGYKGLFYSTAENGSPTMDYKENPVFYDNTLYNQNISMIARHKKRLVIEFDAVEEDSDNPKESLQFIKKLLEKYCIGFIQSSHKSKNSDYLWVEFTQELTTEHAEKFLYWLNPNGSNIDLNFPSDERAFPVLFAKHWKGSGERELPVEFHAGRKIDYMSLGIDNITVKKSMSMKNGDFYYTGGDDSFLQYDGIDKFTGKKKFSVNVDKVAIYIENKFNIRTIYGLREETIEVYDEGIWTIKGRGIIKSEIERLLTNYSKINSVNEVLEKIKRRTEVNREEADEIPDFKRAIENGVLNLESHKDVHLIEHSKKFNFRHKFPVTYDEKKDCPKIKEFIHKTFYNEDIQKVQEWVGLHLARKYFEKKATIFHGPKDTGKTVFLNLLTIFLGGNVSGLSLQEISRGKPFDLMDLKDKDANICDDLSSADMKAVGGFKMAVGDGYITGEQKFGDKIKFRNTAKDTNACNKIPSPGEDIDDEAYYGRILLIPVENVVSKDKQDKNLINLLTTQDELSGFLNWAIEGYRRLVEQNGFSNDKSPEETKFFMVQNGNSLAEFSGEVITQSDGNKIIKDDLYQIYCNWCMNHKPQLSPDTKDKIGKTLTRFVPFAHSSSNGKERYWLNVKINDSYYTFQNNMRDSEKSSSSDSDDSKVKNKSVVVKNKNHDTKIKRYIIPKGVIPVIDADEYNNIKPERV